VLCALPASSVVAEQSFVQPLTFQRVLAMAHYYSGGVDALTGVRSPLDDC
jgi:hypothetical protein